MKKPASRAFTLVEMVIAVMIVLILAVAAAPSYVGLRNRSALRSGAEQLLGELSEKRLESVKTNAQVKVDLTGLVDDLSTHQHIEVKENTLGDLVLEPRLAMLTDATAAGHIDLVLGDYLLRFGVTPVGQGYICTPVDAIPMGYPTCDA